MQSITASSAASASFCVAAVAPSCSAFPAPTPGAEPTEQSPLPHQDVHDQTLRYEGEIALAQVGEGGKVEQRQESPKSRDPPFHGLGRIKPSPSRIATCPSRFIEAASLFSQLVCKGGRPSSRQQARTLSNFIAAFPRRAGFTGRRIMCCLHNRVNVGVRGGGAYAYRKRWLRWS